MTTHVYYSADSTLETAFSVTATAMKFGPRVLAELGGDAAGLGMKRVAVFLDHAVAGTEAAADALGSLRTAGMDAVVWDQTRIEPTDASFRAAAGFARDGRFDGYVSIGGGSVMDTAKAANLYATWPDDFLAYVNAPIGAAKPVPGPLKPHIACPTTCGTGSETTGAAIFDLAEQRVKTGISHRFLKPTLAVVDPTTTYTLPAGVVASTGFDVFTHAIESYTARPYTTRERPDGPAARPVYQGANPYSDIGAMEAIRLGARYIVRAVEDPGDAEARDALMLASTLAGLAFGNAGVHVPHAMSYSVAGLNHSWTAPGYESEDPMVPHGISVVVNAPAAFRFGAPAAPERHRAVAEALGATGVDADEGGEALAERLLAMMRRTGMPNGLEEIGYSESDIPALAAGAIAQQRLLVNAPRPVDEADLRGIYREAMRYR